MASQSDRQLDRQFVTEALGRLKQDRSDASAFSTVYQIVSRRLLTLLVSRGFRLEMAEDIIQDYFVDGFWTSLERVDLSRQTDPINFLFKGAMFAAQNVRRKALQELPAETPEVDYHQDRHDMAELRRLIRQLILECLAALDDARGRLIVLHKFMLPREFTLRDVAESLEMTYENVRQKFSRTWRSFETKLSNRLRALGLDEREFAAGLALMDNWAQTEIFSDPERRLMRSLLHEEDVSQQLSASQGPDDDQAFVTLLRETLAALKPRGADFMTDPHNEDDLLLDWVDDPTAARPDLASRRQSPDTSIAMFAGVQNLLSVTAPGSLIQDIEAWAQAAAVDLDEIPARLGITQDELLRLARPEPPEELVDRVVSVLRPVAAEHTALNAQAEEILARRRRD